MGFGPVSTYAVDFPLDIVLHPAALAKYQVCIKSITGVGLSPSQAVS